MRAEPPQQPHPRLTEGRPIDADDHCSGCLRLSESTVLCYLGLGAEEQSSPKTDRPAEEAADSARHLGSPCV